MRKIMSWAVAMVAAVLFTLGLTAGAAQAQPREINIGPITVCSVITFFDIVIYEWDCYTTD